MKTVCIIPARGGSVRIPRKNIKPFHGRPIIEYSIETAKRSRLFDEIVVSTDEMDIQQVAFGAGADIVHWRQPDDGTRGTQEVAAQVLDYRRDASFACVLYATAPLITWRDLLQGWYRLRDTAKLYSLSVNNTEDDIGGFYWGAAAAFVQGVPLEGNSAHVFIPDNRAIDINTPEDWARAESMFANLRGASA